MNPRQARRSLISSIQVRKHRPDYGLVVIACILLGIGLIVMYSISPALAAQGGGVSDNYYVNKQFIATILGLIAFIAVSRIPLTFWEKYQKILIGVTFILCLASIGLGGLGSRWITIGALSFQPVELVKFTLIISGAGVMARAVSSGSIGKLSSLKPLIITLLAFSFIIIGLQKDLGSAFVLLAMIGIMAFVAGLPMKRLLIFAGVVLFIVIIAISSTAYRRERFLTFLQPERDCATSGYQACQALIAVGSGGTFGLGVGRSIQAYGYLPESNNDSIFAIYAEKFGFIGAVILIGIVGSLLLRILNIMQRAPNKATQLMCAGVFAWFGIQAIINIGAMIGLLPLKGITLPFISYGGTSLVFSMAALGIVFQISSYTSMRQSSVSYDNERGNNESNNNWRRNSRPHYTITRNSL